MSYSNEKSVCLYLLIILNVVISVIAVQPSWTSKERRPLKVINVEQLIAVKSTFYKINPVHLLLLLVFMFFVSLPVGCHAFVSPMLALLGARSCLVLWSICHEIEQLHLPIYRIRRKALLGSCTIGTSPLSMR